MPWDGEQHRRDRAADRLVLRWYRAEDEERYQRMKREARAVVDREAEGGR